MSLQGSLCVSVSKRSTSQKGAEWGRRVSILVAGRGPNFLFSKVSRMASRLWSHRPGTWFWKDRPDVTVIQMGPPGAGCGRKAGPAGVVLTRPLDLTCAPADL